MDATECLGTIRTALKFAEDKYRTHDYEPRGDEDRAMFERIRKDNLQRVSDAREYLGELERAAKAGGAR